MTRCLPRQQTQVGLKDSRLVKMITAFVPVEWQHHRFLRVPGQQDQHYEQDLKLETVQFACIDFASVQHSAVASSQAPCFPG